MRARHVRIVLSGVAVAILVDGCAHTTARVATASRSTGPPQATRAEAPPAAPPARAAPVRSPGVGSAVVLARVGTREIAYIADADDRDIVVADAETLQEISTLDVGSAPAQLLLTKQGRLFATLRDRGEVAAIEGTGVDDDALRVVATASAACEPLAIATPPDEASLVVASGWGHTLASYDVTTLTRQWARDLDREPRAVLVSDDGKRAVVSYAVGSNLDVIDLATRETIRRVSLMGSQFGVDRGEIPSRPGDELPTYAGQAFAIARGLTPAGRVFVPHTRMRPGRVEEPFGPPGSVGYGSTDVGPTETFNVAVLDESTGTPLPDSVSTDGGLNCVLPRAAAATDEGELLVACLGTSEVVALDGAAANPHQAVTQRWHVPAGPMGIAMDDTLPRALVWSQFDHALTWLLAHDRSHVVVASNALPRKAPFSAAFARGRVLFHLSDERISADGRTCASCHPDGRDDGLVWSTPDGPRNPPMLSGRLASTKPYGWLGRAPDVAAHLKQTFSRLGAKSGKAGLGDDDKRALMAYLDEMKPPPVEPRAGTNQTLVAEGQRIFQSKDAACADCHGFDGVTPDAMRHNVLSWAHGDAIGIFDTPSLRFVGGTAPYFHDGRYATLRALLTHTRGIMGQHKPLSDAELDALDAYVKTL